MLIRFFFVVLLCAFSAIANAEGVIKVALFAGFSGVANISSFNLLYGAKMEVEKINSKGGFEGKKIELVVLDDESDPIKTIELINDKRLDDVVGIIGFPWSKFLLIAGEHLQKKGIPTISITATHDSATQVGDYIFRVCYTNSYQGEKLSRYAFKKLGVRRSLLFVNLENSYSSDLASSMQTQFEKLGGKIVEKIKYIPKHKKDYFIDQIKNIPVSSYDVVLIPDTQVYAMPIMEAFRELEIDDKIYIGGDGWNMADTQMYDDRFKNYKTYVAGHWDFANPRIENKEFIKGFFELTYANPQDAAALTHDALYVLLDAIKRAGSLDHKKIKDALLKTNYTGLTGNIRFDSNRNVLHKQMIIHEVDKGKRRSFVY